MKNCADVDDDDFKYDDDDGGADHRYRNAKPGKVGSKVLLAIVSLLVLLRLLNIAIVLRYFIWGIRDKVPEVRRRMAVRTLAASSFLVAALAVPSVYYSCFSFNFRASITCAFQSAFFAIWLVARDRSLQSPFFRTPLKYLYITGALAVVRFTLIILSSGNFTADNDGGYYHQPGFTLYILFDVSNGVGVLTCLIMSYQFLKPLAGYRPEGMTSAVIKEVILRTGIGALTVVLFLCVVSLPAATCLRSRLQIITTPHYSFATTTLHCANQVPHRRALLVRQFSQPLRRGCQGRYEPESPDRDRGRL